MDTGRSDLGGRRVITGMSLDVVPLGQDDVFHHTAGDGKNRIAGDEDHLAIFQCDPGFLDRGHCPLEIDRQLAAARLHCCIAVDFVSRHPLSVRVTLCVALDKVAHRDVLADCVVRVAVTGENSVGGDDHDFAAVQSELAPVDGGDRSLDVHDDLARSATVRRH